MSEFASWLVQELEARGWSRAELARRGGVTSTSVDQVVNGLTRPGLKFARAVARAFEMRAAGLGIRAIMRETGLVKSRQGMLRLLANPIYKGIYVYSSEEWPGVAPALVDAAQWDAAQQTPKIHPRTRGANYLLTGLLRCGYCGYAMCGNRTRVRFKNGRLWERRYYWCSKRNTHLDACAAPMAHAEALEADVFELVLADFLAPEPFARFVALARATANTAAQTARAEQLERQIAAAETALGGMVDLLGQGIAVAVVADKLKAQEEVLRELRQARATLGNPHPLMVASEAELRDFVERLRERLTTDNVDAQRAVLHEVIEVIRFGPELVIEYRLPHG